MIQTHDNHEEIICKTCNGTGNIEWDCPDCWGSGYAPNLKIMRKCKDGSNKCPTCCGKGKITDKCLICGGSGTK